MGIGKVFGIAVALAMVAWASVAPASNVHALAPKVESFDFEENGVASCGAFNAVAHYAGTVKITTYFNAQGDPIRALFQGRARGTLTNSVTGFTVKDAPSIRNGFFDLVTDRVTNVGVDFHITVPGSGVVVLQAGRIVFDGAGPPIFIAGPHFPPPVQMAMICAALDR